eukprot:scaffold267197_cov149-Cyclotella_meneghiniana.AAC.1
MGDASGDGFSSALWDAQDVEVEAGNYVYSLREESSNYREGDNLTTRMELLEKQGKLAGKEVFIFTDNMSFEGCFYKGHSVSEKLSDIILRLRLVQARSGAIMHVIHIAGTRMKWAGIDGLSRGDMLEGMMHAQAHPLNFLPLCQSAADRSGQALLNWIDSWWKDGDGNTWGGKKLRHLTPKDWFSLKDVDAPRLWIPPPSAMPTVIEMFNDDRLERPQYPHVFVVPRLMTHLWRKQLSKDADFSPTLMSTATKARGWLKELILPVKQRPVSTTGSSYGEHRGMTQTNFMSWKGTCRGCGKVRKNGAGLFCSNFLMQRGSFPPCMNVWCGECYKAHPNDPFPVQEPPEEEDGIEDLVKEKGAFKCGRDGDYLMGIPFECDLCHFRNVTKRDPELTNSKDCHTLMCIRRAILDALWSRATRTVRSNLNRILADCQSADFTFELHDYLPKLGWPVVEDRVGMAVALVMLNASLRPGQYADHLQYDSMRKTPTWFRNIHEAGTGYSVDTIYAQDEKK